MYRANYPNSGADVLDDRARFRPEAIRACRRLARGKPWRGTVRERLAKFRACLRGLAAAYGIPCPRLRYLPASFDCYRERDNTIVLAKLSVVTLLHEFAHARGFDERRACRFSLNLFRRVFPRSFARCRFEGHMLVARGR